MGCVVWIHVAQVTARQREIEQVEELVSQTHNQLEAERQRALYLVRNFTPALADQLQRDFDADVALDAK